MVKYLRPLLFGLTGFFALLAFYFILMSILTRSWDSTWFQFEKLWYYMIPLSAGFGVQVGMYTRMREIAKHTRSNGVMMTNTTTSTVGMIACCAHHITDVLPVLGLSAASLFLIKFQTPILIIGIVSNIVGISYLYKMMKK